MKKEYLVQPEMYGERKADYKKGEEINKKWKPISSKEAYEKNPNGTCGNIGSHITVNAKTRKVKFNKDFTFDDKENLNLHEVISSAFALYRIICMIENPIVETEGAAGYKTPWKVQLIHVETGNILGIFEWKGAFGIWTKFHNPNELPASYKKDVAELLNLMFSDRSPHPYDNCTAGIVA